MTYEKYQHLLNKLNSIVPSDEQQFEELILLKDELCDDPASLDEEESWSIEQAILSFEAMA